MENGIERDLSRMATVLRKHSINQVYAAQSGHPGGSLSCADIITVLYFNEMNVDPQSPIWPDRDRFVLSKGHCAPVLYAALAERGFFDATKLSGLRQIDSFLEGHPNMNTVPGVDMSTGSLGQGISAAVGMAIAGKLDKKGYRVYTLLGDGEMQEGQVWEALMAAAHYKLDNLVVFLDHNGLQIDGKVTDVMSIEPIEKKFEAFGFNTLVIDGHDYMQIIEALETAKLCIGQPTAIVANTTKGKGVSFMENAAGWHGSAPNEEQKNQAIRELDQLLSGLEEE